MKTLKLKEGLYYTGVLDWNLRVFDIIMKTEYGTTYNSYLLKGSEKTVLFETAKAKFLDEYMASVSGLTDLSKIDYIVVNHTEPDHSGSIEHILRLNPDVKIVGTTAAINFLKKIVNREFHAVIVKDDMTLSIGDRTLRFFVLPNLHWPDTMFTFVEEDKLLVTCDAFGAHYCHEGILRSAVTDEAAYLKAAKYYFDMILGPFLHPYLANALKRIQGIGIDMILTGHGPVLDSHIDELLALYKKWCEKPEPNEKATVVIPYVSAYGYTRQLAQTIEEGIRQSGDIDVRLYDMVEEDHNRVLDEIKRADGVLFGTPTMVGDALEPIWNLTVSMFPGVHGGKPAGAFGSYGWSGEGVPNITERLKQLRMKTVDGFRVRFKPSESELAAAQDYGYAFGCKVLGKENDRAAKQEA